MPTTTTSLLLQKFQTQKGRNQFRVGGGGCKVIHRREHHLFGPTDLRKYWSNNGFYWVCPSKLGVPIDLIREEGIEGYLFTIKYQLQARENYNIQQSFKCSFDSVQEIFNPWT